MQTTETVDIGAKVSDFFGFKCITELVFRVVDAAIIGAGILLLVFRLRRRRLADFRWRQAKLESARAKLSNALIGVAIIAASLRHLDYCPHFLFGIDAPVSVPPILSAKHLTAA